MPGPAWESQSRRARRAGSWSGHKSSCLGKEQCCRSILLAVPVGDTAVGGGGGVELGNIRDQLPWVLQRSGRQKLLCSVVASPSPQFIYRFSKLFS